MAVDWDKLVIAPVMTIFGEEDASSPETTTPTYYPVVGAPFDLNGVFDEAYRAIDLNDTTSDISTVDPVLGVRLADFPTGVAPAADDKVKIPRMGATYLVRNVRVDGRGWALLDLLLVAQP
ncbi:MAG TPA: hypothetical protein VFB02_13860 [Bradyrhizobium sp.]|nr:hypothetical protein [Bradyrhizobium sp.]